MAIITTQPDVFYQRSRESLLPYEDARLNSLMAGVPNFYVPQSDSTKWGTFLRAIAKELARLDYAYAYDMVGMNPAYLTPPDIKRRYAGPLFINRDYPNATQSDQGYKAMLVGLIQAYGEGTTVQAITDVITAYTGQQVAVQELYKLIGQGYDASYRNTLRVGVTINGADLNAGAQAAANIQTIAENLYSAIALATPAHVGLDYMLIFGGDEDMSEIIAGITDTYRPILMGVEAAPLPNILTESPLMDPNSPQTELTSAYNYSKTVGQFFAPTVTASQYAAMSADYQGEYIPDFNGDGGYTLNPTCLGDLIVLDSSGNPTNQITKPGVLAPQLNSTWGITSEVLTIYELD